MADYNFTEIEKKWQEIWANQETFKTQFPDSRPKYYVLDMFPYPSGAGLHVGHPLGYIASDIVARFKRAKGFNVLHPMGFDAFGLPAEQYAIQTGRHPADTTRENIARYTEQLKNLGFSYDWSRQISTCDPKYYKWTQWIFCRLFESWYDYTQAKARHINELVAQFEQSGNQNINAACNDDTPSFTAAEWQQFSPAVKQDILLKYRLAYLAEAYVNWCPALGTVLANEEVKDGFSERGNHPVERKIMLQWCLRITAYAERLLQGLDTLDWTDALKEMQRNWVGKSEGALVTFKLEKTQQPLPESLKPEIEVFTTRLDTIYGVTFMCLAPEHELVNYITTPDRKTEVDEYIKKTAAKSERDRQADVKTVSGAFTGAYAINPFSGQRVPVYIADYVLAGYGTGAVMAVPSGDQRDWNFATHFQLPIVPILSAQQNLDQQADPTKEGTYINSGIINGMSYDEAMATLFQFLEANNCGTRKVNYRLRDAIFSRQRYWGEPVPVYFDDNNKPQLIHESELPLILPEVDKFLPTATGEPPLARATNWKYKGKYEYEKSTMPGWAGSSWYFLRYMDPNNDQAFVSKEAEQYWQNVDLYVGGAEHATGHLLYARFWQKFLFDLGLVSTEEPFKKLVNQGMIQGRSNIVYRIKATNQFVSAGLKEQYDTIPMHVDVNMVHNDELDMEAFKKWRPDLADATFITENGKYICGYEIEKMSKSLFNVVNPDHIISKYGADTLRVYEMFLGPLEQFKPWNTNGIEGSFKFLKKLWRLYFDNKGNFALSDAEPSRDELKTLHKTIKKVAEDIDRLSLNTCISTLMVCVNELTAAKCNKRAILEPLLQVVAPFAPHIASELWELCGRSDNLHFAPFPQHDESYLSESMFDYPISINGKVRTKISLPLQKSPKEIEDEVLASEAVHRWTEGKTPKKVIVVPGRIVNVVV
jgi:leucyl-tRNA synthetase